MEKAVLINDYDVNIEELKKKYLKNTITFTYPSVVPIKTIAGMQCYLALYLSPDGIPQHCQCSSEEEAWYFLNYQLRGRKEYETD